MAAIGSPNTIVVSSVDEFSVGNTIQVSNSALTLVAQITAINPTTLTLTATTLAIVSLERLVPTCQLVLPCNWGPCQEQP